MKSVTPKIKILLIEDDKRQIKWAKQCLSDYDLTVATSSNPIYSIYDGYEHKLSLFDLIITDLYLPEYDEFSAHGRPASESSREPRSKNGMRVFNRAISCLKSGKVRGVALVSDIRTHGASMPDDELLIMQTMSKVVEYGNQNNLIIWFYQPLKEYTHCLTSAGQVVSREDGQSVEDIVRNCGGLRLKPYPQIVKRLLEK